MVKELKTDIKSKDTLGMTTDLMDLEQKLNNLTKMKEIKQAKKEFGIK